MCLVNHDVSFLWLPFFVCEMLPFFLNIWKNYRVPKNNSEQ